MVGAVIVYLYVALGILRMRGDGWLAILNDLSMYQYSPHARGWLVEFLPFERLAIVFSACAGMVGGRCKNLVMRLGLPHMIGNDWTSL